MLFIGPHVFLGNHERINIHPSGHSCYHVCFDTQIFDFRYSHAKNCFCRLQLSFIDLNSSADLSPCANFAGWPVGPCGEGLDVKCTAERKGSCQCSYIVITTQSRTSQDWGALYMVPEWLSFWNEFRLRAKFILLSQDKIKQLKQRHQIKIIACVVFAPDQIHIHHSLQTTRFAIFNPEQSSFSVYMIPEFNFLQEQEFHSEGEPKWIHSRMTCTRTKCCFGIM